MRATVRLDRCDSTGECVKLCPRLFRFHPGHKRAVVTEDPVPPEMEECCLRAAEACPMDAVVVTGEPGTDVRP